MDSLLLNSYERSVGTEVKVTCLSPTHALTGETDVLVCENGGQWSSEIPRCVDRRLLDNDGDIIETTTRGSISRVLFLFLYIKQQQQQQQQQQQNLPVNL